MISRNWTCESRKKGISRYHYWVILSHWSCCYGFCGMVFSRLEEATNHLLQPRGVIYLLLLVKFINLNYWQQATLRLQKTAKLQFLFISLIPESIRWLLTNDYYSEAVEVLKKISESNKIPLSNYVLKGQEKYKDNQVSNFLKAIICLSNCRNSATTQWYVPEIV